MSMQSVDKALEAAENALRDFIQEVLEKKFAKEWLEKCGISEKRRKQWEEWRDKEKEKDPTGIAEDRVLYYSDFGDLRSIINRNWDLFEPCFKDKARIVSRLQELKGFRDTDAHRRELLTHQKQIVLGYCGEIRTAIIRYRSKQTPEGEYFPKIEYVKDSFGNISKGSFVDKEHVLRPGDEVEFVVKAYDPLDEPLEYRFRAPGRESCQVTWEETKKAEKYNVELDIGDVVLITPLFGFLPDGSKLVNSEWTTSNRATWRVTEEDIGTYCMIWIAIRSPRKYHASEELDDAVQFFYTVLPEEPPKKKS